MKKMIFFVMLLCSLGFTHSHEEKTDLRPLYRLVVPMSTAILVYKAFDEYDTGEIDEQFKLLLISMGVSMTSSLIYELVDDRSFKLKHIGQYGMGMLTGVSFILLWDF